jgi:hypothetical protein
MLIRAALLVSILFMGMPGAASAAEQMQAGMWEVSVTVEMPGMAMAMPMPPTTQTQCMTKEEANADPVPSLDKGACRATDIRRSGNKVSWKLTCSGTPSGRGEGEITYQGPTAYDGWMTLETSGVTVRSKVSARRIGGC